MNPEYICLSLMTCFYLLAWFPASIGKAKTYGNKWLASNRGYIPDKPLPRWAGRSERAYSNLKDYFPGFVVAILVLGQMNKFDEGSEIAAIIYLVSRICHFTAYTIGNVGFRLVFYVLAMVSNFYLLGKIILS